ERQRELVGRDAAAVVAHADELRPARLELDADRPRPGIERVLDQLLDHRRGALHHLAGGNLVHEVRRELAYRHGRGCGRGRAHSSKSGPGCVGAGIARERETNAHRARRHGRLREAAAQEPAGIGILSVWPTRSVSLERLLVAFSTDMLTLYRWAISLSVSPREMT